MKKFEYYIVATLLLVHLLLGLHTISFLSPTYDEPLHLTSGYSYFKTGDYRLNAYDHPPFAEMWAAIPLVFMNPQLPVQHPYWAETWKYQYPFADLFLYHNNKDPETMLNSGRAMNLLLSVFLGFLIFLWSKRMFGGPSGLIALALWCFMPVFLGNGTLVTTDMALTLFYFSTLFVFWKWWQIDPKNLRQKALWAALFGISTGLLLASKYSAAIVFPVLGMILAYKLLTGGKFRNPVLQTAVYLSAILAVLLLVFQFNSLSEYYVKGFRNILKLVGQGRSSFLMGKYSTTGWLEYFPIVFLIKTPIGFLLILLLSFFRRKLYDRERILFLLLPAAFYFLVSCTSKVQIGHRHIMPVYPFLIVWASGFYAYEKHLINKSLIILLVALSGFSSLRNHPWHLSYFNELIGPQDNGYNYLTDSNIDWGQGLKELSKYLKKEKAGPIYLCYFGTGNPVYYRINYMPIGFIDNLSDSALYNHRPGLPAGKQAATALFQGEHKVLLAISATNLQATYYADKEIFAFLKNIAPEKIVARSILVYDLSAHRREYGKFMQLLDSLRR
jgi:hypothetical protein